MRVTETMRATPSAAELRGWVRARRTRPPTAFTASLLFERLLYLMVPGTVAVRLVGAGLGTAGKEPLASIEIVRSMAVVVMALCLVFLAKALLAFGPLHVDAPERTWLFSTPVDRGRLLLGRFALATAVGAIASTLLGVAFAAAAGLPVPAVPWLVSWATIGSSVTCVCVWAQARLRSVARVQQWLNAVACAIFGAGVVALIAHPGDPLPGPERLDSVVYQACALLMVVVLLLVVVVLGRRGLGSVSRSTLSSGVELANATRASIMSLDATLFWPVVLERRARRVARVRPAPIRGGRFGALVRADLARVRRGRTGLFIWAALIAVPYAAHMSGVSDLLSALQVIIAFLAVDRLAGGLRIVSRSPAIRRTLGGSDRLLTAAHLVVPAAGAVIWVTVTAVISGIPPIAAVISAVGAVAVSYRVATRPPMDYSGGLIDFGVFGPTPVGLVRQLARGPALLVGLALLQSLVTG
ncbi:DUF6297 family protein [Nonomuraea sp. NPDC049141]|uniref:DUF6297 family protein n=1 Tax=Nonomuraea sp. NPDC049141 TaxID=3155500 RepID=UPI0033CB1401